MSIDDDIFEVGDVIDTLTISGVKESYNRITDYIAYVEELNDRLTDENIAMRSVIKIIKPENENGSM